MLVENYRRLLYHFSHTPFPLMSPPRTAGVVLETKTGPDVGTDLACGVWLSLGSALPSVNRLDSPKVLAIPLGITLGAGYPAPSYRFDRVRYGRALSGRSRYAPVRHGGDRAPRRRGDAWLRTSTTVRARCCPRRRHRRNRSQPGRRPTGALCCRRRSRSGSRRRSWAGADWRRRPPSSGRRIAGVVPRLVPRTRSSHHNCRDSDCELRVQSGTRIIALLVSFDSEVRIGACGKIERTSESGH